jgi:shikimate dehydrogenase
MHGAALAARGDAAAHRYLAVEVHAGGLRDAVREAVAAGLRGLSVTTPLKEEAVALADIVDDASRAAHSANTLVFGGVGVEATTTDGDGCCDALERHGATVAGSVCAVIGAGATARSVVAALGRRGAAAVLVVNRTRERAVAATALAHVARAAEPSDIALARIVVNCTSVGMGSWESPIPTGLVGEGTTVLDAVYHPVRTRFLAESAAAGASCIDGVWMLAHQAARQQERWFGALPDAASMHAAAVAELARR